ncbi:MAG: hypothetical protein ACJ75H_00370 [Thermoanaerobaculia bacterium]
MSESKFDVYKLAFQHTQYEIDILWKRNNAFLVANSALVLVVGIVRESAEYAASLALLGLALTIVWYRANRYSYMWNRYWIRELKRLEGDLENCSLWTRAGSADGIKQGRPSVRFDAHEVYIAVVFIVGWLAILMFFTLPWLIGRPY